MATRICGQQHTQASIPIVPLGLPPPPNPDVACYHHSINFTTPERRPDSNVQLATLSVSNNKYQCLMAVHADDDRDTFVEVGCFRNLHQSRILCVSQSRCGRWIATTSLDGTVAILQAPNFGDAFRLVNKDRPLGATSTSAGAMWTAAFDSYQPGATRMAYGGDSGEVMVLENLVEFADKNKDAPPKLRTLRGHTGPVMDVAWSCHNSAFLASASADATIIIWNAKPSSPKAAAATATTQWCRLATLRGHTDVVRCIAFFPNSDYERRLVSGSNDGTVRVWDLYTTQPKPATGGEQQQKQQPQQQQQAEFISDDLPIRRPNHADALRVLADVFACCDSTQRYSSAVLGFRQPVMTTISSSDSGENSRLVTNVYYVLRPTKNCCEVAVCSSDGHFETFSEIAQALRFPANPDENSFLNERILELKTGKMGHIELLSTRKLRHSVPLDAAGAAIAADSIFAAAPQGSLNCCFIPTACGSLRVCVILRGQRVSSWIENTTTDLCLNVTSQPKQQHQQAGKFTHFSLCGSVQNTTMCFMRLGSVVLSIEASRIVAQRLVHIFDADFSSSSSAAPVHLATGAKHARAVRCIALSHDGSRIVTVGSDSGICLWSATAADGEVTNLQTCPHTVGSRIFRCVCFLDDKGTVVAAGAECGRVFVLTTSPDGAFEGHTGQDVFTPVSCNVLLRSRRWNCLFIGGDSAQLRIVYKPIHTRFWMRGDCLSSGMLESRGISALALSPDEEFLAIGSVSGGMVLHAIVSDADTQAHVSPHIIPFCRCDSQDVSSLGFLRGATTTELVLAAGSADRKSLVLWAIDASNQQHPQQRPPVGVPREVAPSVKVTTSPFVGNVHTFFGGSAILTLQEDGNFSVLKLNHKPPAETSDSSISSTFTVENAKNFRLNLNSSSNNSGSFVATADSSRIYLGTSSGTLGFADMSFPDSTPLCSYDLRRHGASAIDVIEIFHETSVMRFWGRDSMPGVNKAANLQTAPLDSVRLVIDEDVKSWRFEEVAGIEY